MSGTGWAHVLSLTCYLVPVVDAECWKNGMKIAGNFEMFLKAIVKVFKDIGNSLKFLCVRGIYIQLKVC